MKKTDIEIKAAMRVSLSIELKSGDGKVTGNLSLSSVVEEVSDDGCLLIYMPLHHGYHYPLPRDDSFLMHFFVDSAMYELPVLFVERIMRDSMVFAKVRRRGRIKPGQRRDCYRLSCSLPVVIERQGTDETKQPVEGQMIDFSDGGMLFGSDVDIEKDEKLILAFDIGTVESVSCCVALRTERTENGKYRYKTAVRFKCGDKIQKRRFYKFVLDKQMEERRRQMQGFKPPYVPQREQNEGLCDSASGEDESVVAAHLVSAPQMA